MARAAGTKGKTRIQQEKTNLILDAALNIFSTYGFRGSTIDQIAIEAGLSKPNILYYFDGKETCLLYTSPSPRDRTRSRMPSSA